MAFMRVFSVPALMLSVMVAFASDAGVTYCTGKVASYDDSYRSAATSYDFYIMGFKFVFGSVSH